jgi:hypothetical protein
MARAGLPSWFRSLAGATVLVAGCSPSSGAAGSDSGGRGVGAYGGSSGSGGTAPQAGSSSGGVGTGGTSPVIGPGASGAAGTGGLDACAGEVTKGELVPVDMLVMLDISGSMLDLLDTGTDKWTAVKGALHTFLSDPGSNGLGVGIQYFPLQKPDAPASCSSNAECGDSGPCFLKLCWGAFESGLGLPCETEADCSSVATDYGPCQSFGQCSDDRSYVCNQIGLPCISATESLGVCTAPISSCLNTVECSLTPYATPAVPVATLPEAAGPLLESIDAQMPDGQTPTGPALSGAVQQARAYADEHLDHTVVAVLATDGLPTRCDPLEVADIGAIAAAAVAAPQSVRTFVIGVFGPEDTDAPANLDTIARAGGTDAAFIVDTSQGVSAQFLAALNEIRGSSLACEFRIPAPASGGSLDYTRVNVDFTQGAAKTRLYKVSGAAACGTGDGWYFDDPVSPTRIILCPTSCTTAQAATDASVEVQLGCKTEVR